MSKKRKAQRQPLADLARMYLPRIAGILRAIAVRCWLSLLNRFRGRGPIVIVDAGWRQPRHLRSLLVRAANSYASALGTELPRGLRVLVQQVVYEDRQLNALLQSCDGGDGRRYIIYLALSVNGRQVSEEELLAALRYQLNKVLEDRVGKPVVNLPLDLEVPRLRAGSPIVEMRPESGQRQDGHRHAVPIQRIEDNQAA